MPLTKALRGLKVTDAEQGHVSVLFATLKQIDHDNDVTLPGAFTDGQKVRISAYNHASWGPAALPVGKGQIREDGNEAVFDGEFFLNTAAGRETFETVKAMGDLQEWSYGYDVEDGEPGEWEGKSVTLLKKLKVHEVSPVLLGAGVGTRTLGVKSYKPGEPVKCRKCERACEIVLGADGALKSAVCPEHGKQLDSEIEDQLQDAGAARYGTGDAWVYLLDHDDDEGFAIFRVCDGNGGDRTLKVPYTRTDETVVLGAGDQEVDQQTSYVAKSRGQDPDGVKGAIAYDKTKTSDDPWDGPAEVRKLSTPITAGTARGMFAWYDGEAKDGNDDGWPDAKSAYKFPHHFGVDGPASTKACSAVIAILNGGRGGSSIPDADRKAVYNHVAKHLKDAGETPAELKDRPGGELKLADQIHVVGHAVDEMLIGDVDELTGRLGDVVTLRAEQGKSLGDETRDHVGQLADRLESAAKALREVVTSADADPDAPEADEPRLTLEDETQLAENLARLGLSL